MKVHFQSLEMSKHQGHFSKYTQEYLLCFKWTHYFVSTFLLAVYNGLHCYYRKI